MAKNMEPIELPVLFVSEDQVVLQDLGIETVETVVRSIMFYDIKAIAGYNHKGEDCSEVFISGDSFICTIPYEKLKTMIKWK